MKRKMRRKLQSIFSIFLCVLMIVPNVTTAYAYDEPAVVEDYTDNTEDSSEEDSSIIITSNVGEDGSESDEVLSEEYASEEIESEEQQSEEKSEIKSEEQNSENVSEEENSETTSEEKNSEKASEEKSEKSSEEENSELTSEDLEDDTVKANIELTFTDGVTVIINNEDTIVRVLRHGEYVYSVDEDGNSATCSYDDKYVIDNFDVDNDINITFVVNDGYVVTDYSIINGEETVVEESEAEIYEYNTKVTAEENIYINITTDTTEDVVDFNKLTDEQKYIYEHLNRDYVNKVTEFLPGDLILLKSTVADKHKLSGESFEGLFTGDTSHIADAYLYQSDSAIGLYDLDKKSNYLVGLVDTLKDDDDFTIIDYTFAKSNANGEVLDDFIFDTDTGLLYVSKSLVDYLEDGSVNLGANQLQILYAFDDGTDNIEIKEIKDEDGKTEEIHLSTAAPKVFARMAAPTLLAAASDIPTTGYISGDVQVGDWSEFDFVYGYTTANGGHITISNILADPTGNASFFNSILAATTNVNALQTNFDACFPHRLTVQQTTQYTFNSIYNVQKNPTMTLYQGIYPLECIHTHSPYNKSPKPVEKIRATILKVDINGPSGYVWVGLTCPEINTQSGAAVIKLSYIPDTTIENKKVGFRIKKIVDGIDPVKPLQSCVFNVYDTNYTFITQLVTDANGEAVFDNYPISNYETYKTFLIKEIDCPEGYDLDKNWHTIQATENGATAEPVLVVKDKPLPSIYVQKVDTDGNFLTNPAYCQIKKVKADGTETTVVGAFPCGTKNLNKVQVFLPEPGSYILHEYKAPDGYLQAVDIPFTVTYDNVAKPLTIKMEDPYITIKINKKEKNSDGTAGKYIAGAKLILYRRVDGEYILYKDGIVSTTNGVTLKYIPKGSYKLVEIEAPEGYLRADPLFFTVTDETVDVQEFTMLDPDTELSILKVDEKGDPLVGAHLSLYTTTYNSSTKKYSRGELKYSWISDGQPYVIKKLPLDAVYWLEEIKAPAGYISFGHKLIQFGHQHTEDCYQFNSTPWPLVYATVGSNGDSSELWICAACGEEVLYQWYDNYGDIHDEISNRAEVMTFGHLDEWYTNSSHTAVSKTKNSTYSTCVKDLFPSSGKIQVYKDAKLKNSDGTYKYSYRDKNNPDVNIGHDGDGKDRYYWNLYWWDDTAHTAASRSGYYFKITNASQMYETINVNDKEAYIYKTGGGISSLRGFHINCKNNGSTPSNPASYNLEPYASNASWDPADHADDGYNLICEIPEDQTRQYVIKVPNMTTGRGFQVAKTKEDGTLLAGAKLQVYKLNSSSGRSELIREFISTEDYEYFNDVENGKYVLVEIEPPVGYKIAAPKQFTIDNNHKTVTVTMKDEPIKIYIDKKVVGDGTDQYSMSAKLEIRRYSDGTVVDSWKSNGYRHEITGKVNINETYILHETQEDPGTQIAPDFKFKVNDDGKIIPVGDFDNRIYQLSADQKVIICYNIKNIVRFIKQDDSGHRIAGAKLQLINKETGKVVDTWISGEDVYDNGSIKPHELRGLKPGVYIWREVTPIPGYYEKGEHVDQEITITNKEQLFTFNKTNIAYKVDFSKVDASKGGMVSGAKLSLWQTDANGNPTKFIDEWTTDGTKHRITGLPEGDYVLYELEAPTGYDYANQLIFDGKVNNSLTFTVDYSEIDTNSASAHDIVIQDPRLQAEFELLKVDGATGEPITDDTAEFEFLEYNATTNQYEVSKHYWIESVGDGYYSVFNDLDEVEDHFLQWTPTNQGKFGYKEIKAPYNADVDPNIQYFDITADVDANTNDIILSNDTSHVCPLHPAREWTVECHKIFLGHNAKTANGYFDNYMIFEDPNLAPQYEGKVFANNAFRGGFELVKWDKDSVTSSKTSNIVQGDVSDMSGFEFKLYNRSGKAVYVYPDGTDSSKVKVENNGLIGVYTCDSTGTISSTSAKTILVTNSTGYIGIPHQSLSSGTYELIETKAKEGYQLPTGDEKSIIFTIAKDDEYFHFEYNKVTNADNIKSTNQYFADKIIRGDVQLTKYDKELNKSEVIGGSDHGNNTISAKLNNIQFEIINKSTNPVYVNNKWYNKDEVVTTITTHWNADKKAYTAETTGNLLPYGTYTIREKTAGEGYIKTDAIQNFEIRNNNEVVTVNTNGELLKLSNQIVRGDVQFKKVSNDTGRLIKAPFLITNVATKEKHIVVTNSQGLYSSGTAQHSNNTNGNDALLAKYEADPNYAPTKEELDDTAGIWFGQGENGSNAPVDDTLGALPYGDYVLQELRSHSNEGLELVTINFSVGKSNETDNPSIDLDIIYDITSDYPGIKSSAVENTSITHVAKAGTTVTIVDRIDLWDLVSEENYKAVGYLIDKKTGNKIKYKGAEVTDEHSFVADGRTENFNLSFTFDTTGYEGSSVVVYVYLYKEGKLEDNDKTKEGVNINNISETVVIPTIHTSLEDEFTKDNVVVVYETAEKSKVIDTVSYKNLAINTATDYAETPDDITENQTYTIKGKLYDKTTNKVVATSEVTFTPTTTDGTVKVPYEFKGENGHTYVATEELYVNNVLVAEHNDLEDEAQTVYSPRGWTEAIDVTTGTHAGVVGENQIIKDTVYYENLVIGKTYTIKGTLMDKETNTAVVQNGAPVTASTVFTASKTSGHIELEFVVDTTLFKDKAIVVFEDFYHKNINVYSHADINDENQTITYSDLKTTAIDANTTDNVAVAGTTTIKDKVQCSNLIVGKTYEIKGVLMDKKTGEYLGKDLGLSTPISATKKFTAEAKDQVVEMVFTLDGSKLQGKTCVVFENLYLDDKRISTHEMIDDVDQTVYFPSVHTTAITDTGLKEQLADKGQLIYDKVELNNLVVGKEYTVTGKVYDKATKEAVKEGNDFITSSQTFTATDAHMIIELKFTIKDASKLNGKTMVVFEKLYHNNYEVATHEDINDFEQSVKYPNLETNACDIKTKLDEIPNDTVTISDEIDYSNLEKGATYTVKGTIYRKDVNKPMLFADGYVVGTTTFVAQADKATVIDKKFEYVQTLEDLNAALASSDKTTTELGETKSNQVVNGKVEVVFENINAKDLYGKTMVVFEYLYRDKILVGIHADINDDNQDIKTLDISTFAREKETGIQELICSKETHVVDTVSITNATENNTYTITSKIVDINTDEIIATFKNDYKITNKNYVETKDGYKIYNVDIEMTFDSTKLAGRSFVIYEYVQRDNETLALHENKNDLKQRLYFPNIGTSAKDSETKDSDSLAEKDDVLIDTVKFENLTKGELYYVTGTLMDKETKKPVVIDGKEVTSTTYFYAGENKPLDTIPTKTRDSVINSGEKVSGTIDVTFKFDSTSLAGKDIVVFEKAYTFDNIIVGKHEDIDDKDQTIKYPKVGTTLLDKSTESHEGMARDKAVYIDTVKYENLIVGKEYTVTGTLMDKETGKPLEIEGATSSTTFTATSANGEVEVKFTINSSSLGSKNIVCFEDLYRNNKKVAVHADLQDENQTVRITPPPGSPTKYVKVKIAKADKLRTYYMLKGAEITIYNADGTIAKDINGNDCVGVTDENGLVWFHLYQHTWDHYYAKETKAPKGYAICNDKFDIYATDDMSKDTDGAYQININVFDMWLLIPPKTGDNLPILPIGLILFLSSAMGVTGVILLRRKRRNQDK